MNYKTNSWLYYFPQKIRGVFTLGWDYKAQLYSILQGFYLYLFLIFSIKPLYMENLSLFIALILQSLPSTCRVDDISSKIHYKKTRAIVALINRSYNPKNHWYRSKWAIPALFFPCFLVLHNECDNSPVGPTPTILKPPV